jgi:hypothetical protein
VPSQTMTLFVNCTYALHALFQKRYKEYQSHDCSVSNSTNHCINITIQPVS